MCVCYLFERGARRAYEIEPAQEKAGSAQNKKPWLERSAEPASQPARNQPENQDELFQEYLSEEEAAPIRMAAFRELKPNSLAICCFLLLFASSNLKATCQTLIDGSPDGAAPSNANSDIGSDLDNSIGVQADVGGHQRQSWPAPASSNSATAGKNSSRLARSREKGGSRWKPNAPS